MRFFTSLSFVQNDRKAFTLIELLIVISIIAILAGAVIIVITPGERLAEARNTTRGRHAHALESALYVYQIDHGDLPGDVTYTLQEICNTGSKKPNEVNLGECDDYTNLSFLVSQGYIPSIPTDPQLAFNNSHNIAYASSLGGTGYWVAQDRTGRIGIVQNNKEISCFTNWIPVPGNTMYGTNDFCVMKYHAKCEESATGACGNPGTYLPVSQPDHTPWISISWTNSKDRCEAIDAQTLTNAQWMTIARNVEANPDNWTTETIGSGHLYRGHTDNDPPNALVASANDNDGYYGTGNISPSEQRRTLVLTNGQTIWDLSGNVWHFLDELTADPCNQPGEACLFALNNGDWIEWNNVTDYGRYFYDQLRASNSSWTISNSMGRLYRYNATNRVWMRGGNWSDGSYAGAFALYLYSSAASTDTRDGFRCAR